MAREEPLRPAERRAVSAWVASGTSGDLRGPMEALSVDELRDLIAVLGDHGEDKDEEPAREPVGGSRTGRGRAG
jgi:hypothetical protein